MHAVTFLQDLAVVMIVAGLVTVIFHRFKQPVVLGYIVAGVIIGPHTPPFPLIQDEETIHTLAELGVMFLHVFARAGVQSAETAEGGGHGVDCGGVGNPAAWSGSATKSGGCSAGSNMDSLFLGAMLSMSSTTIIVKALGELGKTKEQFAKLIFGILIVEDILAIAMIALLSGHRDDREPERWRGVRTTLGSWASSWWWRWWLGLIAVPRLLGYVARFKSNEMLLITVLGLCFGVSLLAAKLGYSVALGAFVIGAVIAEAREIHRVETLSSRCGTCSARCSLWPSGC